MGNRKDWEEIRRLGGGGQSDVFLVRDEERRSKRSRCLDQIRLALDGDKRAELVEAILSYGREDLPNELGALKVFKIQPEDRTTLGPTPGSEDYEAINRLENEINALRKNRPGLPKLLDSNIAERWIVTEYFSEGTLEDHPLKYKRKVALALKAFESLVQTVAFLHESEDIVIHRDIKPANVFIRNEKDLVLGDFGIAYMADGANRVTQTGERVGPRDYMPPWANLGVRNEVVEPSFDVYMLGKLLWCMIAGRTMLPREYHRHPDFDLTKNFPNDPDMYLVNKILDECLVEHPKDCLASANQLLERVRDGLKIIDRGGQLLMTDVPRPCRVCGCGFYEPERLSSKGTTSSIQFLENRTSNVTNFLVETFVCNACGHVEFFRPRHHS